MYKIVLLRHGESVWNRENRFTGWTDVGLSPLGAEEAAQAGLILKREGYVFDLVFTSVLKRAVETTEIVLRQLGLESIETKRAWQLNERHYGALQGLNKAEMAREYGEDQVLVWRRSFSVRPPEMAAADFAKQASEPAFGGLAKADLPKTESLSDTYVRAVGYWNSDIAPEIAAGRRVLVSAHGNSLRALVKYLDGISDGDISGVNIPTGIPLVYELDGNLKPAAHYYLGDAENIARRIEKVKSQGKK